MADDSDPGIGPTLRRIVIVVVVAVFVINFLAQFIIKDYSPDQTINGIFLAIIGGLFGLEQQAKSKQEKERRERGDRSPPRKSPEPKQTEDEKEQFAQWQEYMKWKRDNGMDFALELRRGLGWIIS